MKKFFKTSMVSTTINLHVDKLFEFMRFCTVGLGNTIINYVIYIVLLKFFNFHYLLAGAIAYLTSAIFGFLVNRKWTFKTKVSLAHVFTYLLVNSFSMMINALVQWITVKHLHMAMEFSQLYGIIVTTFINYFMIRTFVFKKRRKHVLTNQISSQ